MDDGGAGFERLFGIEHRRQRLEIELDQLRRVLGGVAAVCDDDRDRLADVADLVMGQQRLLRIDEFVLHQRRPFARQRHLRVRHRRQHARELRPGQHKDNAGRGGGARHVDRLDARMRLRAADEHRMQHVRQIRDRQCIGRGRSRSRRSSRRVMERPMKGVWSFIAKGECGTRVADNQSTPARPTATYLNFARFISSAR